MIEKLKKFGLTGYESQAYLTLLRLGDAEANEIAINAKIPMGRIYSVLSSLEEARIIHVQDTRPKRYICVEPTAVLERLSKNKQKELKQEAAEIEALVYDIVSELADMTTGKPARSFWTVAIGEESLELIRECILGAKKELLFFLASKTTSERVKNELMSDTHSSSRTIGALHEALKKGVEVRVIINKDVDFSLLESYPAVKKLLMHLGNEFNCRLAAIPTTPFDIIDRENVLLRMQNPLNPEELFAVVNIRDTKLAEELRKRFFTIWEEAEAYPGKNAIAEANQAKVRIRTGM